MYALKFQDLTISFKKNKKQKNKLDKCPGEQMIVWEQQDFQFHIT